MRKSFVYATLAGVRINLPDCLTALRKRGQHMPIGRWLVDHGRRGPMQTNVILTGSAVPNADSASSAPLPITPNVHLVIAWRPVVRNADFRRALGIGLAVEADRNEAVGRPFDSTVNGARMIGAGVFDRHPKLQVLIVHMGGELASVLGRLEFTWRLNYKGIGSPPAGRPYTNTRPPSDYFKTNILVDCMGFNPIGLRAAVEMCGVDRVVFGSDYGPIPLASSSILVL